MLEELKKRITRACPKRLAPTFELTEPQQQKDIRHWYSSDNDISYSPLVTESIVERGKWVPGWPLTAAPPTKGGRVYLVKLLSDITAVTASLPFLILGAYAANRNGATVNEKEWEKLQTGMSAAVTAFPIVFSAVMGRMTKSAATWRLERGSSLGHLEQLLGSSTVFNTISTQLLVGSINYLAIGLFFLWALSPLGGQASLHIIAKVPRPIVSTANVSSFRTEQKSFFEISGNIMNYIPTLNGMYMTALLSPQRIKQSPVDLWGNVKIPILSQLGPSFEANETGWYDFKDMNPVLPYSSLVGIPVLNISLEGNTTFNIESSYFDINCHDLSLDSYVPISHKPNITVNSDPPSLVEFENGTFIGSNGSESCPESRCHLSFSLGLSHYAENRALSGPESYPNVIGNNETKLPLSPTLLFESRYWAKPHPSTTVAYCSIKRIYVESAIECIGDPALLRKPQCSVTAMRNSLQPHPASDITPFIYPGMLLEFSAQLAQSGGQGHYATATLTERYLNDSDSPLLAPSVDLPLFRLPKVIFSQRITQIINTYYIASVLRDGMVGDLKAVISSPSFVPYGGNATNSVPATMTTSLHDTYVTNGIWLAVFIISSLVMFAAAALSAALGHLTFIPDVLGYVSSLTRDSKYVALPDGGSTLDGLARSRLLRHRAVRLGDIQEGRDVGLLAFADGERAARVQSGRRYA